MDLDLAISIVNRQSPCPHYNADTNLGSGTIWARCDDCGSTFSQEFLPKAIESSRRFDEAVEVLRKGVSETESLQEQVEKYKNLVRGLRTGLLVSGLRSLPTKSKQELIEEINRLFPEVI